MFKQLAYHTTIPAFFSYLFIMLYIQYNLPRGSGFISLLLAAIVAILSIGIASAGDAIRPPQTTLSVFLIILITLTLLTRIIPYLQQAAVPLGYDPGLYKHLFEHFDQWADWHRSGYSAGFTLVMGWLTRLLGIRITLIPLYVVLSVAGGVGLYAALRQFGHSKAGLIALGLFGLSISQYEAYYLHYYKNVIALGLLMLTMPAMQHQQWRRLLILGGAVGCIHRPALLLLGITGGVMLTATLFQRQSHTAFRWFGTLCGIALITILCSIDRVDVYLLSGVLRFGDQLLGRINASGAFFDVPTYLHVNRYLLPFVGVGIIHHGRKQRIAMIMLSILLVIVIGDLFFAHRYLIYIDMLVIFFAALGLQTTWHWTVANLWSKLVIIGFITAMSFQLIGTVRGIQPLISPAEMGEIQQIDAHISPDAVIIATSTYYAPWLRGWTNARVIAQGMFLDDQQFSDAAWDDLRQQRNIRRHLDTLNGTPYLHSGERQTHFVYSGVCFTHIPIGETHLYRYDC